MKCTYCITTVLVACSAAIADTNAQEKANPFTGTTAAFEQRLRTLEEKKIDAAIASEELAKEKSDQERVRLRSVGRPGPVLFGDPAAPAGGAPGKAKPAVKVEPVEPIPAPRPKPPRLVGTVATAAGWIALVEKGATVINVPDRATVDGVSVSQVSQNGAVLNGVYVELEASTVARISAPPVVAAGTRAAGSASPATVAQGPAVPTEALDLAGRR